MVFFFLVTGYSSRGFRIIPVKLLGRFRGAHLKVPHLSMLPLACVVHAQWCFYGNSLKLGPLPHRKGRDSGEQHFTEQANRQKNTRIKLLQNNNACGSSLFTHIFTLLCIKKKYLYCAAKYECIELSAQQRHLDLVGQCPTCPKCRNATVD